MPYQYKPIKLERGIGLIPTNIFGEQEGAAEPWGGRMSIFDEPVPEDSGPAPRRYRSNPMAAPDAQGRMWAMGQYGPYVAYSVGPRTPFNLIARWNAKIGNRGDYFIDPPNLRSMKKKAKKR